MRILEAIVAMNGALQANLDTPPNAAMLNRVLASAAQLAGHDYLVMVISDFDGADDDTRRCLMQLAQHNDVLGVLVHDPSATHLPPSQDLVITDGRLQIEVPWVGSASAATSTHSPWPHCPRAGVAGGNRRADAAAQHR